MSTAIASAVVLLLLLFWVVGAYGRLVGLRRQFRLAFPPVVVQLEQRYDLIPSLVETARGWMKQERETLETVIDARNEAVAAHGAAAADPGNADAVAVLNRADEVLEAALDSMYTLAAAHSELMDNQNMVQLTGELAAINGRLAFARQAYNESVTAYNVARTQFPVSLVAAVFAFPPAQAFGLGYRGQDSAPAGVAC